MLPRWSDKGPWWASLNSSCLNSLLAGTYIIPLNRSLPFFPRLKFVALLGAIHLLNSSYSASFNHSSKLWERNRGRVVNSAKSDPSSSKQTFTWRYSKTTTVFFLKASATMLAFLGRDSIGIGLNLSASLGTLSSYGLRSYDTSSHRDSISRFLVLAP